MPCQCTNYLNHIEHTVEEVQFHLFKDRINLSYINWTRHGEKDKPSISAPKPFNATTEFVDNMDFTSDIPTDGPATIEIVNATKVNFHEDDLVKFQELLLDAEKPLYEGCHNFTKLSVIVKVLNLKGVDTYDVSIKDNFNLRAILLWTISDYPALEKNVAESLAGTLLHVSGETKDGVNARLDMAELGVKPELFSMQEEEKTTLPQACYTLTNTEKDTFCKTLRNIRVPQGYCSNFSSLVALKDRKLIGLKSYDYHMVERELAISKESVSETITWISYGPRAAVVKYDAYNINWYTFPSKCHDGKVYQNSGVHHRAGGVKRDTLGYTLVDINNLGHKTPPKNYKDTYDEVDEEFSTVIHQRIDSILPRVNQRDLEIIVVNLDSSSGNNSSDSCSTSQISTSEEIDYDSPEPPKSLLKWYHYLSNEYKDNGRFWGPKSRCNKSDVKPSWKDIKKAKACMLAKAKASKASFKTKVKAESAGTSTAQVILFGTIPTAIPATVPIVDSPVVHDDTPLIPTETHTIPPVVSTLPHTSLFLYTDSSDSDTIERPPSQDPYKESYEAYTESDIGLNVQTYIVAAKAAIAIEATARVKTDTKINREDEVKEEAESSHRGTVEIRFDTVVELVVSKDNPVPADDGSYREVVYIGLDEMVQELQDHLEEILVRRIMVIESV
nr:hypothetical protein [Tanacetum cinerariifolium]